MASGRWTSADPTEFSGTRRSSRRYSGGTQMRTRFWLAAILIVAFTAPALADRRTEAKEYVEWGITCAQKSLWPQAVIQFEKATEKDPTYAAAWNNLGIGYEELGRFDDARK